MLADVMVCVEEHWFAYIYASYAGASSHNTFGLYYTWPTT